MERKVKKIEYFDIFIKVLQHFALSKEEEMWSRSLSFSSLEVASISNTQTDPFTWSDHKVILPHWFFLMRSHSLLITLGSRVWR